MYKLTLSLPFAVVNAKQSKPVSEQIERVGPFQFSRQISFLVNYLVLWSSSCRASGLNLISRKN